MAWHIRACLWREPETPASPGAACTPGLVSRRGRRHAEKLVPALQLLLVVLRYQSLDVSQLVVQVLTAVLLLAVVRVSLGETERVVSDDKEKVIQIINQKIHK